jgi:hypothetical protein
MEQQGMSFEDDRVGRHQPPRLALGEREEFVCATVVFILADNQSVEAARVDKDLPHPSCLEP